MRDSFIERLDKLLGSSDFADHCPNGLQVEGRKEVRKIGFAVSASLAAILEAKKRGVDLLIVHHGIFWNKDPYPIVGWKKERVAALLEAGISLAAYHLPLDAHPILGNNWKAGIDLGWQNLSPFGLYGKQEIGVKGSFPSIPVSEFQKELEAYYGHKAHTALGGKPLVSSVALISGGAHRSIEMAADAGIDCFITGSFDEMIWDLAFERGIHFFALGHYATERVGIFALRKYVEQEWGIPCESIDLVNPF